VLQRLLRLITRHSVARMPVRAPGGGFAPFPKDESAAARRHRRPDLEGMPVPDRDDSRRFGHALNLCTHLKTLLLQTVGFGDSGVEELAQQLLDGALPRVEELSRNFRSL